MSQTNCGKDAGAKDGDNLKVYIPLFIDMLVPGLLQVTPLQGKVAQPMVKVDQHLGRC